MKIKTTSTRKEVSYKAEITRDQLLAVFPDIPRDARIFLRIPGNKGWCLEDFDIDNAYQALQVTWTTVETEESE